jgi:hypothetical protein
MGSRTPFPAILAASFLLLSTSVRAGEHGGKKPAQPPLAAFEGLKALAGEWAGTARMDGSDKPFPVRATVKVVSAGSAVMLVTAPDTEHEMVTMFHRDDDALLATHYCAAQNQPRMKAGPGADGKRVEFQFVDGTNLKAYPGRMQSLVVAMPDADHHVQTWTYLDGQERSTMTFELARVR